MNYDVDQLDILLTLDEDQLHCQSVYVPSEVRLVVPIWVDDFLEGTQEPPRHSYEHDPKDISHKHQLVQDGGSI